MKKKRNLKILVQCTSSTPYLSELYLWNGNCQTSWKSFYHWQAVEEKKGKLIHILYILWKVLGLFTAYTEQQVTYKNEGPTYRHLWDTWGLPHSESPNHLSRTKVSQQLYERIVYLQHKLLFTDASSICAST